MQRIAAQLTLGMVCLGLAAPLAASPLPEFVQLNEARLWQRLEFQVTNVPMAQNPFDPDIIRLDATITLPSARTLNVPAFWYQAYERSLAGREHDISSGAPQWRLRFTPPEIGNYSVSLAIQTNNQPCGEPLRAHFVVKAEKAPTGSGYARVTAGNRYFQTDNGKPLLLNGANVAWPGRRNTYDYDTWFAAMHKAGENYARIWMWPSSFGIETSSDALNNYSLEPAWQLDYVLQLAEQNGIYVQLCLDFHGMFATKADYFGGNNHWASNPYNIANGGPCAAPNDFFTNPTARQLYQKRLRYLIARYGYSQNLFAWEFFNEVDNDYSFLNSHDVTAWHDVMSSWMHTNDVYGHLMTTSLTYASRHAELWKLPFLSFSSYHCYNQSNTAPALARIASSFVGKYDKPLVIGEFGTSWKGWDKPHDPYLRGFRQGLWGGMVGGSAGTSMAWWWEDLARDNVYPLYTTLAQVLRQTNLGEGTWTNLTFSTNQNSSAMAIGMGSQQEALLYVVARDASFPQGATNSFLPVQHGQAITLRKWPAGYYHVQWYDPASGARIGLSDAVSTDDLLSLPLPDFTDDVAGIVR